MIETYLLYLTRNPTFVQLSSRKRHITPISQIVRDKEESTFVQVTSETASMPGSSVGTKPETPSRAEDLVAWGGVSSLISKVGTIFDKIDLPPNNSSAPIKKNVRS